MPDEAGPGLPAVPSAVTGRPGTAPPGGDEAPTVDSASLDDTRGRTGGRIERGRRWVGAKRFWMEGVLQERRKRGGFVAAGYDVQGFDADVGGGILAGAVAFRMFLFMVPFVYIVFTMLGLIADTTNQDPAHLAKTVGITGVLASAVVSTQDQSAWTQTILVIGATGALVLTSRSLIKTLFVVNRLIWQTPRVKPSGTRPMLMLIAIALVMSILGVALDDLRSAAGVLGAVLMICVVNAAAFGLWWWVSWLLPHASVSVRALIPGAVLWAIGLDGLQILTTYWIGPLVSRKSNTYGAVGIALAVLLWVYVLGRIIVGSSGLNATLWRRQDGRQDVGPRSDATRSPRLAGPPD